MTDNTVTDTTEEVADNADTEESTEEKPDAGQNADIPADSSDVDGQIEFSDCGFHWYPMILILLIAVYTGIRIKKVREELEE